MAIWTHINGGLVFHVPLFKENAIKTYEDAIKRLKDHFGPFSTYYNGVSYEDVRLPQGSEGSVRYYFTDMTDYARNERRKSSSDNILEIGVMLTGKLRDYAPEEGLTRWIESLDSLITDDYRIILEHGLITTRSFGKRNYFRYTGMEWLLNDEPIKCSSEVYVLEEPKTPNTDIIFYDSRCWTRVDTNNDDHFRFETTKEGASLLEDGETLPPIEFHQIGPDCVRQVFTLTLDSTGRIKTIKSDNTTFAQKLDQALKEEFYPAHHGPIKEFFETITKLNLYTPAQLDQLLVQEAIGIYDEKYFGEYLSDHYGKDFSDYTPGQYDADSGLYRSLNGKYVIEQQIF